MTFSLLKNTAFKRVSYRPSFGSFRFLSVRASAIAFAKSGAPQEVIKYANPNLPY